MQSVDNEWLATDCSRDSLLDGAIAFYQPRRGYRVNVDSVLLARFASAGRRGGAAVDLGAGVGVVSLLLAHFRAARELILVESEPNAARLARYNLEAAGVRGRVLEADVASTALATLRQSASLVVCNPPFYRSERHRAPFDAARSRARMGELSPFVRAAGRLLNGDKARAVFAYPAASLPELIQAATAEALVPKRLRLVHPYADRPARLALLELRRARPGGLVVEAPLIEWASPRVPHHEFLKMTNGAPDPNE